MTYDPATYAARRRQPTRETYAAVMMDVLQQGYSFIRVSAVNRMKSKMRREQLRWRFVREDGRVRVTPMKE